METEDFVGRCERGEFRQKILKKGNSEIEVYYVPT
jgi:hypothetical protein